MAAPEEPRFPGRTVLVVEDHDAARKALCAIIASFGAAAIGARDGEEALVAALARRPDLVLCDLRMPGMDGFEFLEQLRMLPAFDQVPVIAMTGLGSDADLERIASAGFDAHVMKPLLSETIVEQLQRVFGAAERS